MVEPTPSSSFEVAEPDLLLELKTVVLDAPAELRVIDQATKADVLGKRSGATRSAWPITLAISST
jgi:hypothetical protein